MLYNGDDYGRETARETDLWHKVMSVIGNQYTGEIVAEDNRLNGVSLRKWNGFPHSEFLLEFSGVRQARKTDAIGDRTESNCAGLCLYHTTGEQEVEVRRLAIIEDVVVDIVPQLCAMSVKIRTPCRHYAYLQEAKEASTVTAA